jgi:hypothetical protein
VCDISNIARTQTMKSRYRDGYARSCHFAAALGEGNDGSDGCGRRTKIALNPASAGSCESLPGVKPEPEARVARNFGFSNSSRVLEGGLFACTNNLETYSRKLLTGVTESSQFVLARR